MLKRFQMILLKKHEWTFCVGSLPLMLPPKQVCRWESRVMQESCGALNLSLPPKYGSFWLRAQQTTREFADELGRQCLEEGDCFQYPVCCQEPYYSFCFRSLA